MNAQVLSLTPSVSSLHCFFMSICCFEVFKYLSTATKAYDMLISNLKTGKHPQHILLSAYHQNSDTSYLQWSCLS